MNLTTSESQVLFGEDAGGWSSEDWTSSDDRVRGGKSKSYLTCFKSYAEFHGNLDVMTLGGAGFASQRTIAEDRTWNLSDHDGIELIINEADQKQYTFILKDQLLPANPENGREQSTISYEYNFNVSRVFDQKPSTIFIPWADLKATYRGKEKEDASKLNTENIVRISVMMRSFFGTQDGDFSLKIASIAATSLANKDISMKHRQKRNTQSLLT